VIGWQASARTYLVMCQNIHTKKILRFMATTVQYRLRTSPAVE
jgi:hypothetical protein